MQLEPNLFPSRQQRLTEANSDSAKQLPSVEKKSNNPQSQWPVQSLFAWIDKSIKYTRESTLKKKNKKQEILIVFASWSLAIFTSHR